MGNPQNKCGAPTDSKLSGQTLTVANVQNCMAKQQLYMDSASKYKGGELNVNIGLESLSALIDDGGEYKNGYSNGGGVRRHITGKQFPCIS